MRPLLLAIRFLTCVPVPGTHQCRDEHWGRSLLAYPLVGLLIAAIILLPTLLASASVQLQAALVLLAWVLISGGLHLDGLADSADGWAAGMKAADPADMRRITLDVMKDPHAGPVALVTITMTLILKFAAIQSVLEAGYWPLLAAIPVLARTAVPVLLLTTPYVRSTGLAGLMLATLPVKTAWLLSLLVMVAVAVLLRGGGLILVGVAVVVFIALRLLMMRRLGGTTGDTIGAMIELMELVLVVVAGGV